MEAKDTVLSNGKLLEIFGTPNFTERQGREKQAEITAPIFFEEGRKAGRREVVEWVSQHFSHWEAGDDKAPTLGIFRISDIEWQDQCKRCGVL